MGMSAIAISRFHHHDFGVFVPFRTGMHHAAGSGGLHGDSSDITGEEKLARIGGVAQKKLNHCGTKNVSGVDEPKAQFGIDLHHFMKGSRPE